MKQPLSKKDRLHRLIIPAVAIAIVIFISLCLYAFGRNPERVHQLQSYGYLGAFLISLIGNASILLPGVALSALTGLGVLLYPGVGIAGLILVGIAGGAGAAIGEIVGYMAGYSGRGIIENRKLYNRLSGWLRRWGSIAIFVFALMPLFFDLVGLAAGALRFPLWKFILICWAARTILYVVFIVLAVLGWEAVLPYLG